MDDNKIPLFFDGWKYYFTIRKPTQKEIDTLPVYEITSRLPYKPNKYDHKNLINIRVANISEWRSRLGYPTYGTTAATLQNTTQLIPSSQAETREYMRDYYKTRIWALKSKRIHDNLYSDTFYSSLPSVRGYTCFQLFAFKKTKLVKIILMRREPQVSEAYEDVIRSIGTPIKTITDISRAQTDSKWTNINRRCCIETGVTIPHHQHQNYSENEGGNFKFKVLKLLHNTNVLLMLCCRVPGPSGISSLEAYFKR